MNLPSHSGGTQTFSCQRAVLSINAQVIAWVTGRRLFRLSLFWADWRLQDQEGLDIWLGTEQGLNLPTTNCRNSLDNCHNGPWDFASRWANCQGYHVVFRQWTDRKLFDCRRLPTPSCGRAQWLNLATFPLGRHHLTPWTKDEGGDYFRWFLFLHSKWDTFKWDIQFLNISKENIVP